MSSSISQAPSSPRRSRGRTVQTLLASTLLLASLVGLRLSLRPPLPRLDRRPHVDAGQLLAREALARLSAQGELTVITRDTADFPQPALDALLNAFRQTLRRAHTTIHRLHSLEVDPLRPIEIPSGDLLEILRQAPEGSVVVSLMGPPRFTEEQSQLLGPPRAKVIAFCPGNLAEPIDLRPLFERNLLEVAVLPEPRAPATSRSPRASPAAERYIAVTASQADALPSRPIDPTGATP